MRIHIKLRVLNDQGVPFLGRGPVQLLQGIERLGSINKAAREIRMSYVKAWKIIKKMEACLGGKILDTTIGGKDYGGSKLTPLATKFLDSYAAYEAEVVNFAQERFTQTIARIEENNSGKTGAADTEII
jgi:molybdate transport system regulatory protein